MVHWWYHVMLKIINGKINIGDMISVLQMKTISVGIDN